MTNQAAAVWAVANHGPIDTAEMAEILGEPRTSVSQAAKRAWRHGWLTRDQRTGRGPYIYSIAPPETIRDDGALDYEEFIGLDPTELELLELVHEGLSMSEVIDYHMVERARYTVSEWAEERDVVQSTISGNVSQAKEKLSQNAP